jgi:hypothetical protein
LRGGADKEDRQHDAGGAREVLRSLARICSAKRGSRHGVRITRRVSNGDQVSRVASLAMSAVVDFTGYWQRHIAD